MQLTLSEQLTYGTVRIECTVPAGTSTGTGFFFNFVSAQDPNTVFPCIITNKHVVNGATQGRFYLTRQDGAGNPTNNHEMFTVNNFQGQCLQHPDPAVDLALFPLGAVLNQAAQEGKHFFFVPVTKAILPTAADLAELGALEDIVMVGYPNGIWDSVNNKPVVRQGVTATHPNLDYNGRAEFLIDAACFNGSSGSPVFLYNPSGYADRNGNILMGRVRIKLLGVLYAGHQHTATGDVRVVQVPTDTRAMSFSNIPNNLGLIIKAAKILDFEPMIASQFGFPI